MVATNAELLVAHNSPIGSADCEPLVPQISTGVGPQNRIGERVTPRALTVKGLLSFNLAQGTDSQGDIYARVIIAAQKDVKVGAAVLSGAIDAATLLRPALPGVDVQAFTGNTKDLQYPINKDKFRVYYDKIIKFEMEKETSNEAWPRFSARWSYSFKQMPAALTFDTSNGDWANNFAPFVAIGYAYADGSSPDVAQTKLLSTVYSHLTFEDA